MRMRALISRLLNVGFPQLVIYITALLNLVSPIPKSKATARDATRNAGEMLMWTDRKISSYPRVGCVWHVLVYIYIAYIQYSCLIYAARD